MKILLLEDEPNYTDVLTLGLQQEGFESEIVEVATKKGFVDQLKNSSFDLIISDYTLPDINGMQAVQIAVELVPDTPVVIFTGSVGEETAIACLKAGAADYVLKQNPIRLIPATVAALEKARATKRLKESEDALRTSNSEIRALVENSPDIIIRFDRNFRHLYVNPAIQVKMGIPAAAFIGKTHKELGLPAEISVYWQQHLRDVFETGKEKVIEFDFPSPNGLTHFQSRLVPESSQIGSIETVLVIARDITERKQWEDKLKENERKYRQLVETLQEGIWVIDKDAYTTFVNPHMAQMLGYQASEMQGKHLFSFMDEAGIEIAKKNLERRKQGIKELHEFELLTKKGGRVLTTMEVAPILDERGEYAGAIAGVSDITGRKLMENALYESERKYRELVDNLGEVIYEINSAGDVTFINQAILRVAGYKPKRIVGRNLADLIYQGDKDLLHKRLEGLKQGKEYTSEYRIISKSGEVRWIQTSSNAIMEGKKYLGARGTLVDITERKRVEKALQESEEQFRNLVENISDVFYILDPAGKLIYGSPNLFAGSGYAPGEIMGKSYVRLIAPVDRRRVVDFYVAQTSVGVLDTACEFRVLRKDGAILWAEQRTRIVRNGIGKVIEYRNVVRNITDRKVAEESGKRMEAALHESEKKYRELVENLSDVIYEINPRAELVFVNPAIRRVLGYEPEELVGKSVFGLVYQADRDFLLQRLEELKQGIEYPLEYRVKAKSGDIRWIRTWSKPIKEGNTFVGARGTLVDITERKRAEEALQESEKKYRDLVENALFGVYKTNLKGEILYVNEALSRMFEFDSVEEMLSRKISERYRNPNDREVFVNLLKQSGKVINFEVDILTKTEKVKTVILSATLEGHIITGMVRDITEARRTQEIARTYSERLQVLSKQLLEIQEKERSLIARELHDEIGQSLTRIKILLEMDKRDKSNGVGKNLPEAITLTAGLISRVRDMSLDLRPPMLDDLGLVPAIRSHFLHHTEKMDIKTTFVAEPEEMHFSREIEVTCFRVAQEAVTNALRHSRAKSIEVTLKRRETSLELSVRDDGKGFDVETAFRQSAEGKSFGLLGMQERVRLAGGTLVIHSNRNEWSEVQVKFPDVFAASLVGSERNEM